MKDFSQWRYYAYMGVNIGIVFTHPDGRMESRALHDVEVAEWLAAGNTPLPAL